MADSGVAKSATALCYIYDTLLTASYDEWEKLIFLETIVLVDRMPTPQDK